ncbi:unnamed protein product [Phytophthora fragariaefolia]|uniref:Unnamed protein product n=1 Tax=Phytophthora fragariaefolia TaxID=1490495 RepID=A0A9W7D489_9STRA|nr:unnamed protein product [Phytophthora fragariaefolia]
MRYQLFRRGLRNKRLLATLDASSASDILEACEWLMFKDMHRPIEADDEFSKAETTRKKEQGGPVSASVDALALRLKTFKEQQLRQQRLAQRQWQPPRSPRNRVPEVAATPVSNSAGGGHSQEPAAQPFRGIRMSDDSRTQEGVPVRGRCNFKGHGRVV